MLRKIATVIMLTLVLVSTIGFTTTCFIAHANDPESSTDWWSMFRHDANHTGYSTSSVIGPPPPIGLAKSPILIGSNASIRSSLAVADDTVFICALDGYVYAYSAKSPYGIRWRSSIRYGAIYSSPAVVGNMVYFGSDNGNVTAIDASNLGKELWSFTTGGTVRSSPLVLDGILYVGSSDGYVYALNATTGLERWRYWTASAVESSPAVFDNTIFFGSNDGRLYALEKGGRIKWFNETGAAIVSSPAVADGKVFVGSNNTNVYAFDAATGNIIWNNSTGGPVTSSPAFVNDTVIVGSNDGKVYAFDAATGNVKWSKSTGGVVHSSPAIASDGKIFVGSCDNKLYAFKISNGDPIPISNSTTEGPIDSSPAIANGVIFVGSEDRRLYIFAGNKPPVANFTFCPEEPIITEQVTFNASLSFDPDNLTTNNITSYFWNFGDGNSESGIDKVITRHTYFAAGTYDVNLTVQDTLGGSDIAHQSILIDEAWPMFRHVPAHTGNSTSLAPIRNDTTRIQVGPNVNGEDSIYPSPAVAGGLVFMASTNGTVGTVYALNVDASLNWTRTPTMNKKIYGSPAFIDGIVYVGCEDGRLYGWNLNGDLVRNITVCSTIPIYSSAAASENHIFVGAKSQLVYSINRKTGLVDAQSPPLGGAIDSSPAVVSDKVFVGSRNNSVYALYESTLGKIWSYSTGGSVVSSPAVADGIVFVGSEDGRLYAINATTGVQKWNFTTYGSIDSSPAVADGVVFVGSKDGNLYAINIADHSLNWSKPIGLVGYSSPAIAEGKVFVGTQDKRIYALSAKDGSVIWSYQTDGGVESSPAILNEYLYVGSQDGYLYAFHSEVHDVAVLGVTANPTTVGQGGPVDISVTVKNQGSFNETDANVTVYSVNASDYRAYNDSCLVDLDREETVTLDFTWDTADAPMGDYIINATITLSGDEDATNDFKIFDHVTVASLKHDIAVTNVSTSKDGCSPMSVVCLNCTARVNVTVENQGNYEETVNVTAYVTMNSNTTAIGSQNVTLASGETKIITFIWNTTGFSKGNYNVSAKAWPVPGEGNLGNNEFTDPFVHAVTWPGDINGDGKVETKDTFAAERAFGTTRQGPNPEGRSYNPNCDINDDDKIDVRDTYYIRSHYGEVDP